MKTRPYGFVGVDGSFLVSVNLSRRQARDIIRDLKRGREFVRGTSATLKEPFCVRSSHVKYFGPMVDGDEKF